MKEGGNDVTKKHGRNVPIWRKYHGVFGENLVGVLGVREFPLHFWRFFFEVIGRPEHFHVVVASRFIDLGESELTSPYLTWRRSKTATTSFSALGRCGDAHNSIAASRWVVVTCRASL